MKLRTLFLGNLLAAILALPMTAGSVFVSPFDPSEALNFEEMPSAPPAAHLDIMDLDCTAGCLDTSLARSESFTEAGFAMEIEADGVIGPEADSSIFLRRDVFDGLSNLTIRVPRGMHLK